jgi:23S rRNA (cytosine1962-C5)-methyltransferase
MSQNTVWLLKKGMDRRIRSHHPWVYSNELLNSPRGIEAGSLIELRDSKDEFLALGYGHPNSLISFRALTFRPKDKDLTVSELLVASLKNASQLRTRLGYQSTSHRLVHAESDGLPGLVVERFLTADGWQVFVVQAQTAGAQNIVPHITKALELLTVFENENGFSQKTWDQTRVLIKNDSNMRKLDGLEIEEPSWAKSPLETPLVDIIVRDSKFTVDLIHGQKTGFFLDQGYNVSLVREWLKSRRRQSLKILDLFCYVGQWGQGLAQVGQELGIPTQVMLVDSSNSALDLAAKNMKATGAKFQTLKMDIMDKLSDLKEPSFDVVVCDPPALIKGKKDIPSGTRGYLKVNTEALKHTHSGSMFVSCSCSALLKDEEFEQMLSQATRRSGRNVSWILRGSQSPDHPVNLSFPEGRYLKSWIGIVQ